MSAHILLNLLNELGKRDYTFLTTVCFSFRNIQLSSLS